MVVSEGARYVFSSLHASRYYVYNKDLKRKSVFGLKKKKKTQKSKTKILWKRGDKYQEGSKS